MRRSNFSDVYRKQAFAAFNEKNYKLCLILLRDVDLVDDASAALLADCAYEYWNMRGEMESAEAEQEELLKLVKDSFSILLANSPHEKVKAYDYIRLSHIYLVEGSLEGALKIVQLASARGHMLSSMIIIQSWSILKRVVSLKESESCLQYLSSSISMEPKAPAPLVNQQSDTTHVFYIKGSSLPLFHVILHCANYLKRVAMAAQTRAAREKGMLAMKSMIAEAYVLHTHSTSLENDIPLLLQWFNDPQLWMEMGDQLFHTPFLLLAEDSYWEAFIRNPKSGKPLKKIVASMRKYHRAEKVPFLLAKAYDVNPWSLFVRTTLAAVEVQLAREAAANAARNDGRPTSLKLPWNELFREQYVDACIVQASVRGWLVRRSWPGRRARLEEIKAAFLASIDLATENAARLLTRLQVKVLRQWREAVEDILAAKYDAATRVQTVWRRRCAHHLLRRMAARVRRANALFIVTCQNKYDMERLLIFRRWRTVFEEERKHRMAAVLVFILEKNAYRRRVRIGLKRIVPTARRRRLHVLRVRMAEWRDRFECRRRNHARITIRFFVRGSFTRRERERQRLLLLEAEQKVQTFTQELVVKRDFTPLLREMWARWWLELQKVYERKRRALAVRTLHRWLPILHHRKKARAVVRGKRVRLENQSAYLRLKWFRRVASVLLPWKDFVFAARIQRFVRCVRADTALRRLKRLRREVAVFKRHCGVRRKERLLFRWRKFQFLRRRERARAARRIVFLFRRIAFRARLRRLLLRNIRTTDFLHALHSRVQSACFRRLRSAAAHAKLRVVSLAAVAALTRGWLRTGLFLWSLRVSQQAALAELLRIRCLKRIERWYFPGAHESVAVDRLLREEDAQFLSAERKAWEVPRPGRRVLMDERLLAMCKAMKSWTTLFRVRNRLRLGGLALAAARGFHGALLHALAQRLAACSRLQRFCRRRTAWKDCARRRRENRRERELCEAVRGRGQVWLLRRAVAFADAVAAARRRIQGFGRRVLARRAVHVRKAYLRQLDGRETALNSSSMQRVFVRKHWNKMVRVFCAAAHLAMWSNERTWGRRHRQRGREDAASRTGGGLPARGEGDAGSSKRLTNTTASRKGRTISSLSEGRKDHVFAGKPYRNLRQLVQSKSLTGLKEGGPAFSLAHAGRKPWQSVDFHRHLLSAKQSGTIRLDAAAFETQLLPEEIAYFMRHVPTVICQSFSEQGLTLLAEAFAGSKLVLVDGSLSATDVQLHLRKALARKETPNEAGDTAAISDDRGEREGVVLQLNELRMDLPAIQQLCRLLTPAPRGPVDRDHRTSGGDGEGEAGREGEGVGVGGARPVKELVVDGPSTGSLGLALLLRALQVRRGFPVPRPQYLTLRYVIRIARICSA